MEIDLYNSLVIHIKKYMPEIKHIDLWNNQFMRSNGEGEEGRSQQAFQYPCCFIEINPQNFEDYLGGIQKGYYSIRFHLGITSMLTKTIKYLEFKEKFYKIIHRFQHNYWTRLLRRGEIPDYNHDNVNVYIQEYEAMCKDYRVNITDGEEILITGLDIIPGITYSVNINNN